MPYTTRGKMAQLQNSQNPIQQQQKCQKCHSTLQLYQNVFYCPKCHGDLLWEIEVYSAYISLPARIELSLKTTYWDFDTLINKLKELLWEDEIYIFQDPQAYNFYIVVKKRQNAIVYNFMPSGSTITIEAIFFKYL